MAIGMVWGGKGVHSTWFGADPEFIHGINILPVTSASLYLGRHPDYVIANYEEIVAERGSQPVIWQDILWQYLALADPNLALSHYYADIDYSPFDGESRAHTYHWLYNMKKMGEVDFNIVADIPTSSVFRDANDDLTYVAYNAGSQDRLVTFSDGFSMMVAPREMNTHATSPSNPDAPVALLLTDKTSGKVPLTIEFTGSNSFDPNDSPLSYLWDFDDGTTAEVADTVHTFIDVGTYTVRLTVTNDLNLSTSDSVTITVLENGTPYLGEPFAIPGMIEAEYYDEGGEGIAYHDSDTQNHGGQFRPEEGVDIEPSNDIGGGWNIGWIEDGEWVEYTIDVPEDGMYKVSPQVSSVPGGGSLHIEFNGMDLTGNISVPVTGGWQFWEWLDIPEVYLSAGQQIMHVGFHFGQFNLNRIEISAASTDIIEVQEVITHLELKQNYPNPFNPSTKIEFQTPESGLVSLTIYDVIGQKVATLINQVLKPGKHSFTWDASDFASGVYYYRLEARAVRGGENVYVQTRKMMLLK